ncbi:ABC transporter substrate-binding protein [Pararhodonellum marinum]|uniref:ABC transporter substrate-binding protein n=1 Tax=Pararhodonellum marinum TaxID=2755358 RepID=UPI00188E37C3|nr:ABC transporter substrate-binding protein [Pararhodonellum marinum]
MRTTFILFWSIFFFNVQILQAQDELASYKRAKTLIGYGNFSEGMDLLRPYMDSRNYGPLSQYARYHFGRAAFQNGQFELAKTSLQPLLENGDWVKKDDARYLMALANFEEKKYNDALNIIDQIKDPNIREEAEKASFKYLDDASVSFLVGNLNKYQKNRGYIVALKNQLERQSIMSASEATAYGRIKNINAQGELGEVPETRTLNKTLEVAVILPFNYSGGSGTSRLNGNNFVFELYQGINMAAVEAKDAGVDIVIRTFDTERKTDRVKRILNDPFLKLADVIIGPIYPEESELVSTFAEIHKIPFINPLSNLNKEMQTMEFSYLFRPSVESISQGILRYFQANLPGRRVAIAYSGSTRDEVLSKEFATLAQEKGYQIVSNKKVDERDMRNFFADLGIRGQGELQADQLVIFSDDPNVASSTFSVLESITSEVPVIVMDSWLYFNFASFEMLESENFHFVANNTVDFNNEHVDDFRNQFFEQYHIYPSYNTHLGYDLLHWVVESINQKAGFDLRKNLDKNGFKKGKVTLGYDFSRTRFNKHVPIITLENGNLVID